MVRHCHLPIRSRFRPGGLATLLLQRTRLAFASVTLDFDPTLHILVISAIIATDLQPLKESAEPRLQQESSICSEAGRLCRDSGVRRLRKTRLPTSKRVLKCGYLTLILEPTLFRASKLSFQVTSCPNSKASSLTSPARITSFPPL